MRFDLFDAMAQMRKAFGQDGRILLTPDDEGIRIRLSVLDSEIHNVEFMVTYVEMVKDSGVAFLSMKFRDSIEVLKRIRKPEKTAKCRDCDWMIIHPNKSMGCLRANYIISVETEKIKNVLSSGKCADFRRKK